MREEEEVAEGKTSVSRRNKGWGKYPAKREETDNYQDKHGGAKGDQRVPQLRWRKAFTRRRQRPVQRDPKTLKWNYMRTPPSPTTDQNKD